MVVRVGRAQARIGSGGFEVGRWRKDGYLRRQCFDSCARIVLAMEIVKDGNSMSTRGRDSNWDEADEGDVV